MYGIQDKINQILRGAETIRKMNQPQTPHNEVALTTLPPRRDSETKTEMRFRAKANTTRRVAGQMNKTEQAYAALLEERKKAGEIHHYQFEAMALKLAKLTTYTPDFFIINADGTIEFHEVKGHWMGNGRVKIKVAAENHPWFRFVAIQYKKKTWVYEEF